VFGIRLPIVGAVGCSEQGIQEVFVFMVYPRCAVYGFALHRFSVVVWRLLLEDVPVSISMLSRLVVEVSPVLVFDMELLMGVDYDFVYEYVDHVWLLCLTSDFVYGLSGFDHVVSSV